MNDTNKDIGEEGVVQRIKESPRTVSALIIILIVAAAIYAFSDRQGPVGEPTPEGQEEEAVVTTDEESSPTEPTGTAIVTSSPGATKTPAASPRVDDKKQETPQPSRTNEGFVEVAERGNGITHLARRAADRWLQENQAGYTVTAEHRVFIEDYIQNRVGSEGLKIGENRTISFGLIAEAAAAAKDLSDNQLKLLSRYTP